MEFRSGYINIIGKPNAGKSTLSNLLVGERLSIITPKAQTTRRRILGIVNEPGYQLIFTDNPGIIDKPEYKLQEWMNQQIAIALKDADVLCYVATPEEQPDLTIGLMKGLAETEKPLFIVINKIDISSQEALQNSINEWQSAFPKAHIAPISALLDAGVAGLMELIKAALPLHPPYFETDVLTDLQERFFVTEIIREKILEQYHQEIPYAVEVAIEEFKEKEDIIVIRAVIYVIRESQKIIVIGKKGAAIKQLGISSRAVLEEWLGQKVFLELFVKIRGDWKDDERMLKQFGYQ